MIATCEELLAGVGAGESKLTEGKGLTPDPVSIGLRKSLSDEEIAGLSRAWLAIPAIDPGTPEEEAARLAV